MGIKKGDKVRVSKDAPKVYLSSVNNLFKYHVCKVEETDGDSAKIRYTDIGIDSWLAIPTKYLVKVDAEAFSLADVVSDAELHQDNYLNEDKKEAKYHKGDRVRHIKNDECGIVLDIEADGVYVGVAYSLQKRFWKNREIEPVQPTEQTEAEKNPNVGSIKIPVEVDLTDSYWDAYAADLAKEVALKVANKFNDPEQAAEYAVSVAKEVVDGLKRK